MLILTNLTCYIIYSSSWYKKQAYCYKIVLCEDYLDYSGIHFHRKISYKDIMDIEIHSLYIRKTVSISCIRIETKRTYIYCYCEHLPKVIIEDFINSVKYNICK